MTFFISMFRLNILIWEKSSGNLCYYHRFPIKKNLSKNNFDFKSDQGYWMGFIEYDLYLGLFNLPGGMREIARLLNFLFSLIFLELTTQTNNNLGPTFWNKHNWLLYNIYTFSTYIYRYFMPKDDDNPGQH